MVHGRHSNLKQSEEGGNGKEEISSHFTLRQLYGFHLILNDVWSDDGLNKGQN